MTRLFEELEQEIKQAEPSPPEKPGPGLVTQLVQEIEAENKKESQASEEKKIGSTFNTGELEGLGPTIEVGQRQVEDFFKILEEKEKERIEVNKAKNEAEESGSMPPWVHDIKELRRNSSSRARTNLNSLKRPRKNSIHLPQLWAFQKK